MADRCIGLSSGWLLAAEQFIAWLCVLSRLCVFEFGGVVHHLKQLVLLREPLALSFGHRRVLCRTRYAALFGVFGRQWHDDAFGVVDTAVVVKLPIS